jgi:hypothetical protein
MPAGALLAGVVEQPLRDVLPDGVANSLNHFSSLIKSESRPARPKGFRGLEIDG